MENLINRFKRYRTINHIQNTYKNKYAFIGMGNHSINNLYPVLDYLHVDIKYIVTKSDSKAKAISENYSKYQVTTDFNQVLNDDEISGVFISANPKAHFDLVKQALTKNKNVFVEKPLCYSEKELKELVDLEKKSKAFVLVGQQKRYAPAYKILKNEIKNPLNYTLKYVVGNYPEGNALMDLFIHPLDIVVYLFGSAKVVSLQKAGSKQAQTYYVHVQHTNGVVGSIELSTDYYWAKSYEEIFVNTAKKYYQTKNTELLESISKPKSFMSVPVEKFMKQDVQKTYLFEQNNFLPTREQNQLYVSGYFNEIKTFVDLCENRKGQIVSGLIDLIPTYNLISQIK